MTDTEIWKKQRWFRKLIPTYKLAFFYIKDQCDHAGIWKIDCSDLIDDLGIDEFNLSDFVESINTEYDKVTGVKMSKERVKIVNKNTLWITGFMQFQYENREFKVPISSPVKTALMSLGGINVLKDALDNGRLTLTGGLREKYVTLNDNYSSLLEDLRKGLLTPKDKDKDKDKYKSKNNNTVIKVIGEKICENLEFVYFSDGTKQKLGEEQKQNILTGFFKARDIVKGSIF